MKGFFSSIIVVAILLVIIVFVNFTLNNAKTINGIERELIIVEQASKERTLMENNVDRIIQIKLKEQLMKENYNVPLIQTEVNLALLSYLGKRAKATNIYFENENNLTALYLIANSSAFSSSTKGITFAEYTYTSLPAMQTIVSSKFGENTILYFKIPIGYTIRVIG